MSKGGVTEPQRQKLNKTARKQSPVPTFSFFLVLPLTNQENVSGPPRLPCCEQPRTSAAPRCTLLKPRAGDPAPHLELMAEPWSGGFPHFRAGLEPTIASHPSYILPFDYCQISY